MARVDFYVLNQQGEQARNTFACKLAEKAYRLDNTVHIHVSDTDQARELDQLLWTFRQGSFVPHHRIDQPAPGMNSPVTIGCQTEHAARHDLLINLSEELPDCAGSFDRIAELVTSDEDARNRSRERYAAYREQGHELETHKL